MSVGDQTGGEAEEGLVDVVAPLPADPQSAEAVQPSDRALYHPPENAQARAMFHKRWCTSQEARRNGYLT